MEIANDRQQSILDLIGKQGYESVGMLSKLMNVSEMTIRRDLDALEQIGLLRRTHGGAVTENATQQIELDYNVRKNLNADAKRVIGLAAAQKVQDGNSIFLDAGTTVLAMIEGLLTKRITIVTCSLPVAQKLAGQKSIQTILLGGTVRSDIMSVVGPIAQQNLSSFHLDIAFLGTGAIDLKRGLNHSSIEEIPLKTTAARSADKVIVLATHEKIGKSGLMYFLPIKDIDELITNDKGKAKRHLFRAYRA